MDQALWPSYLARKNLVLLQKIFLFIHSFYHYLSSRSKSPTREKGPVLEPITEDLLELTWP